MQSIRVHLEDGTSYETNVSAESTAEEINKYFVGAMLDVGFPGEKMVQCVKVEILE